MGIIKRWLRNIMSFSRGESNAFIVLLPILVLIIFSEPITRWWISHRVENFSKEKATLDSLANAFILARPDVTSNINEVPEEVSHRLFAFDPNRVSVDELQLLGFSEKLAMRISKYKAKGGKFKIKSDLMRIYGMDSTLYRNLYASILLPEKDEIRGEKNKVEYSIVKKEAVKFDLNKADTNQLKLIYGIGSKLSLRIVKYRDQLGGFISKLQLAEVYGLDSSARSQLLLGSYFEDGFQPAKMNINTISEKELEAHPYINRMMAKAIVTYRFQHGNFSSVEEIRNLHQIKEDIADKIIPYIKIE